MTKNHTALDGRFWEAGTGALGHWGTRGTARSLGRCAVWRSWKKIPGQCPFFFFFFFPDFFVRCLVTGWIDLDWDLDLCS